MDFKLEIKNIAKENNIELSVFANQLKGDYQAIESLFDFITEQTTKKETILQLLLFGYRQKINFDFDKLYIIIDKINTVGWNGKFYGGAKNIYQIYLNSKKIDISSETKNVLEKYVELKKIQKTVVKEEKAAAIISEITPKSNERNYSNLILDYEGLKNMQQLINGKKWNHKVYGKQGNFSLYLNGEPFKISDAIAISIKNAEKVFIRSTNFVDNYSPLADFDENYLHDDESLDVENSVDAYLNFTFKTETLSKYAELYNTKLIKSSYEITSTKGESGTAILYQIYVNEIPYFGTFVVTNDVGKKLKHTNLNNEAITKIFAQYEMKKVE